MNTTTACIPMTTTSQTTTTTTTGRQTTPHLLLCHLAPLYECSAERPQVEPGFMQQFETLPQDHS
ncbi:unnamed protein product [Arctogadus glacialis]